MANPQKENGYTPIANEIMDAFVSFRVPGELRQVLDFVIRKTYGFNKKGDNISNSQIINMSGLSKGNVSRALSKLITHKLVIKADNFTKGKMLYFNKNYDEWVSFVIKTDNSKKLSKRITKVIRSDNKKLSEVRDTKDNKRNSKDILRDKSRRVAKKEKTEENKRVRKNDDEAQTLKQYVELMRSSPRKQIRVIGEYADQIKPEFTTVGQWRVFTSRNLRIANDLAVYSEDQIAKAFDKLEKNIKSDKNPRGYITRWTLETLLSYIIH